MKICSNCFRDSEIVSIINSLGENQKRKVICPTCGKKTLFLYDTDEEYDVDISSYISELISAYKVESELDPTFPTSEIRPLAEDLLKNWNIFNKSLSVDKINSIISETAVKSREISDKYLNENVGLFQLYDQKCIDEASILKFGDWDSFIEELKYKNRFHSNYVNEDNLKKLCNYVSHEIKEGQLLYRCRIITDGKKLTNKEMGPPPKGMSSDGRANAFGISRLYLASDKYTAIKEVRSGAFDMVCVGKFHAKEDLTVVDLDRLNKISPFQAGDISLYIINIQILNKINEEISKTLSSSDNRLDYVPTQFIIDLIQSFKDDEGNPLYDGIKYHSTMDEKAYNVALFDSSKCYCERVFHYKVSGITYRINKP